MTKKFLASVLVGLSMVLGCVAPAMADSRKVVTLGADLTEEQKNTMMRYFGVGYDAVDLIYYVFKKIIQISLFLIHILLLTRTKLFF
jgi:uncharacterized protein YpuA (DUF1002 family)